MAYVDFELLKEYQEMNKPNIVPIKPVNRVLLRNTILKDIEDHLSASKQWVTMQYYDHALEYRAKAVALIELLEADDCGSHGGFDEERNQPRPRDPQERYKWLKSLPQNGRYIL